MNDLLNKYYENYEEGVDKLNFNEKLNTFRNKSEQNYELIFHLDGTLGNIACLSYAVIKLKLNVLAVTFETSNNPLLSLVLEVDAGSVGRGYG